MSSITHSTQRSSCRPDSVPDWKRYCSNKTEKTNVLSGKRYRVKKKGPATKEVGEKASSGKSCGEEATDQEYARSIRDCFSELTDPRVNRRRRHLLLDIVVIVMCATICGAEGWKDMQLWGETHQGWLAQFLELPNGIPSRDTLRRVVCRLDPQEFQACFVAWVQGLSNATSGRIVAIDGKTCRRSMDTAKGQNPIHVVSAWATEQHLTLGQLAVDSKSNEITAIPKLLRLLELKGALVTIDAMGCQKEIAAEIVNGGGQYCLAVKANQEHLLLDISGHFVKCLENDFADVPHDYHIEEGTAHGRSEKREYYTTAVPKTLRHLDAWKGLRSIGVAITNRSAVADGDPEIRYYINSFPSDAKKFAHATRQHWGIENSLHWVMDVTFNEDQCRIHKGYGVENVSWLRRIAITLLKNEPTVTDTVRAKRRRAMWDISYLGKVLTAVIRRN